MSSNPVVPTIPLAQSDTAEGLKLTDHLSSAQALAALVEAANALAAVARQLAPAISSQPGPLSPTDSPRLTEAVNQFLVAKARGGRSDRYLRQLRSVLGAFCQGRGRRPVALLGVEELERYIGAQDLAPRTVAGHIRDLRTFLGWCQRRGWTSSNPAQELELPSGPDRRPLEVHTPAEVAQLLEFARERSPDVCRHLAVRYFTGVRSAEAHRLREVHIREDFLEVPASASKTRSRRLIRIQPNLAAWLALGGELRPLSPNTIKAVVRASGVAWSHNVTRHSWCSYHLAHFEHAGRTALEAGHSEAILFRHYRAIVTREAAQAFWNINPGH